METGKLRLIYFSLNRIAISRITSPRPATRMNHLRMYSIWQIYSSLKEGVKLRYLRSNPAFHRTCACYPGLAR